MSIVEAIDVIGRYLISKYPCDLEVSLVTEDYTTVKVMTARGGIIYMGDGHSLSSALIDLARTIRDDTR